MALSRREEILAIAAEQFAAGGVAGTTVRDISSAAGILSGSLYHHFQSKEEMVADLLLPVMERQVSQYRAIVRRGGPAPVVLRELIKTAVIEAAQTPNETRMIRNDAPSLSAMPALKPVTDLLVAAAKLWASVVQQGIDRGELRDCDPKLVVAAMFDAVLSATRWFTGSRPQRPGPVGEAIADLFLQGLRTTVQT
ncbi:MAG TPA: TetR/AcrR family transcriptional regulator [Ilumatobacteraceae bacterium]|jgi:AcrR family transcriptional regulator